MLPLTSLELAWFNRIQTRGVQNQRRLKEKMVPEVGVFGDSLALDAGPSPQRQHIFVF